MPVTPESLAAFEKLVRFFLGMTVFGVILVVAGIILLILSAGETSAGVASALLGMGLVAGFVGLRTWRKGQREVAGMQRELDVHP